MEHPVSLKENAAPGVREASMTWELSCAKFLRSVLNPVARWSLIVGGTALVAIVLMTVVDICLRTTIHVTVPATLEIVKLLMLFVVFSGMCSAELNDSHIKVDTLTNLFSPRIRTIIATNALVAVMALTCLLSVESVRHSGTLVGRHSGLLYIPLWPFPIIISIGMALFFLAVVTNFFEKLSEMVAGVQRNYFLLAFGVLVTGLLLVTGFISGLLPSGISPPQFGVISLVIAFVFIFSEVHIGAAMGLIAFWGISYLATPEAGLSSLGMVAEETGSNYFWLVVPLFVWVGMVVFKAGYSKDLYSTAYKWLGHTPGGLASASVAACSAFAAVVGDTVTGAVTMGTIALPEMKKYRYDDRLATGCIAAGGSLGTLIPPSMGFVVYGLVVEQSIGKLLISGIIPGILASGLMILYIYVRCRITPELGPAGPTTSLKEKLASVKGSLAVMVLFLLVVGGIYSGIVSPTEAASLGAFAAMVLGLFSGRLTFKGIVETLSETLNMSALLFFILIPAVSLTQLFTLSNIPNEASQFIVDASLSRYVTMAFVMVLYLILGCLLPALPVLILTLPVVYPVVMSLGFDPIMFGVIVVILAEIGTITPPFGITVFALGGVADVPMYTIFRGVFPFVIILIGVVILTLLFPQIALFLPGLMKG
jgi:tripartite ATP-independent transporter DctM subunit